MAENDAAADVNEALEADIKQFEATVPRGFRSKGARVFWRHDGEGNVIVKYVTVNIYCWVLRRKMVYTETLEPSKWMKIVSSLMPLYDVYENYV